MRRFDMKRDWDARARQDALFAIACDAGKDEAVFQATGRRDAAMLLEGLDGLLPTRESVLEIGCGIGRVLEPLATEFRHVYGVDVSGEMVRQGRKRLIHLPQAHFVEVDGTGCLPFAGATFDCCFSLITFHHIPYKSVVGRYIGEAHRILKIGGVFRFHLFGRPEGVWQTTRERFTKHSTWRGCKFTFREILATTRQQGFEILEARYLDQSKPHVIWVTARKT